MELFRYSRNVYGQQILEGVNFELLWMFAGFSATIIVAHLAISFFKKPDTSV